LTCKRNQTEAYMQLTKPSYTNQCWNLDFFGGTNRKIKVGTCV
jgi:hypothetical protein